jgi:hypothetical protein
MLGRRKVDKGLENVGLVLVVVKDELLAASEAFEGGCYAFVAETVDASLRELDRDHVSWM